MKTNVGEIFCYVINGFIATGIHFLVLYACVEILNFQFIGLANTLASIFGILFSFIGNKYYVFRSNFGMIKAQLIKFFFFYVIIAFIHGTFLFFWSDLLNKDYNSGFLVVVFIQFTLGYLSSKFFIFNRIY